MAALAAAACDGDHRFRTIQNDSDSAACGKRGALPREAISAFTRVHSPSKTGVNALKDALWRSGAPLIRDPGYFVKKPGSRVCSASFRCASCCAAPGTRNKLV